MFKRISILLLRKQNKGTLMKIGTLQAKELVVRDNYATTSETRCGGCPSSHNGTWD